jgi:hypothetical protein
MGKHSIQGDTVSERIVLALVLLCSVLIVVELATSVAAVAGR